MISEEVKASCSISQVGCAEASHGSQPLRLRSALLCSIVIMSICLSFSGVIFAMVDGRGEVVEDRGRVGSWGWLARIILWVLLVVSGDDDSSDNFRLTCLLLLHAKANQVLCPKTIYSSRHFLQYDLLNMS